MITSNIHGASKVKISETKQLDGTSSHIRKITIRTDRGEWLEFTLFNEDPSALEITTS